MVYNKNSVTQWNSQNTAAISRHRSKPLNHSFGSEWGSTFGMISNTLGVTLPGPLGMVSPTGLFDRDALVKAATTYGLSKISSMLNGAIHGTKWRAYLESLDPKKLISGAMEGYRHNHKIENRGHLSFSFPPESDAGIMSPIDPIIIGGDEPIPLDTFTLPFFENPKITESRGAEYASHKIVNRNEPYRLWTGAKPLKVALNFNITLPHLMSFADVQIRDTCGKVINTNFFKEYLVRSLKDQMVKAGAKEDTASQEFQEKRSTQFYNDMHPEMLNAQGNSSNDSNYDRDIYEPTQEMLTNIMNSMGLATTDNHRARLILYCVYLLNLIRSSVIGSSNNKEVQPDVNADNTGDANPIKDFVKSYLPAPVIFLTYGALYNNEPFIATNYSIEFDGKTGYEELSLFPRVISEKLTLESFNQFDNSDKIYGIPKLFAAGEFMNQHEFEDSHRTAGDDSTAF